MEPMTMLAIAGLGMSAAGMAMNMKGSSRVGYDRNDLDWLYNRRSNEISQFQEQLTQARRAYMAQLPQYQNYVMSRFLPNIQAQLAGQGKQVGGGAFASAMARKASDFQQEQMLEGYNRERADISAVDTAKANLYSGAAGGVGSNFQQPSNGLATGLGQMGSSLMGLGMNMYASNKLDQRIAALSARGMPTTGDTSYLDSSWGRPTQASKGWFFDPMAGR